MQLRPNSPVCPKQHAVLEAIKGNSYYYGADIFVAQRLSRAPLIGFVRRMEEST